VLSVLFMIAVGIASYDTIKKGFDEAAVMEMVRGVQIIMPVLCGKARGVAGTDYTTKENQNPGPLDIYAKPDPFDLCYYTSVPEYRPLFPEFALMREMALVKKIYADAGTPTGDIRNPWVNLLGLIAWTLAIPLVVLAIGSAIMWAFAGFKRDTAA
jgi:hypothetical protein